MALAKNVQNMKYQSLIQRHRSITVYANLNYVVLEPLSVETVNVGIALTVLSQMRLGDDADNFNAQLILELARKNASLVQSTKGKTKPVFCVHSLLVLIDKFS
jgi:hypothetical protein